MKNIIIGNGINIQFGGCDYTNRSIIERGLFNLDRGNYSEEVYSKEIGEWLKMLYQAIPQILNGEYDLFAVTNDEKEELRNFKVRYDKDDKVYQIGFEDYFLVHELFCRKNNIKNPERYDFRELLRRFFLDSIYNSGKINKIHEKFLKSFVSFIESHDYVFTTNYDRNLEISINQKVYYLHGAFHILDDVYNPDSFRNRLSDRPVDKTPVVNGFEHLFSNALTGNSGALKQFAGEMAERTNSALSKFVNGIKSKPEMKQQIEDWKNSDNLIVKNLYEAINIKIDNPNLEFSDDSALKKLKDLKGTLTFIGLSPNNDSHILSAIRDNEKIGTIIFYYYETNEKERVKSFFANKRVIMNCVVGFWNKMN